MKPLEFLELQRAHETFLGLFNTHYGDLVQLGKRIQGAILTEFNRLYPGESLKAYGKCDTPEYRWFQPRCHVRVEHEEYIGIEFWENGCMGGDDEKYHEVAVTEELFTEEGFAAFVDAWVAKEHQVIAAINKKQYEDTQKRIAALKEELKNLEGKMDGIL